MFVPRYLLPAEVERLATIFLREVETALVKELLEVAAKSVTGPNLVVEAHHGEPVIAAVEEERDRLLQRPGATAPPPEDPGLLAAIAAGLSQHLQTEPQATAPAPPAGSDPLAAMAAVLKAEQEEAQAAHAEAAANSEGG